MPTLREKMGNIEHGVISLQFIRYSKKMATYRRMYVPGGTYFFTLVTHQRQSLFSIPENIILLRQATRQIKTEMPFEIIGAVVLPEHIHFIWELPAQDTNYSTRIGKLKVLFTKSLSRTSLQLNDISLSRQKHRESNIWQRRFWEHTIRSDSDLENHLNYIHYNPVKHGLVTCPHLWQYSSFHNWVRKQAYIKDWCCCCDGRKAIIPNFSGISPGE
jgi:putative transposase